jgi:hypothetical protein
VAGSADAIRQLQQLGQRRALAYRLQTKTADQEHGGRARRMQKLLQKRQAVDVGPLQIVDVHDQRSIVGDGTQQAAQRREGTAPELSRIADLSALLSAPLERRHVAQHGEHAQ